jgi:death-on-curing protein
LFESAILRPQNAAYYEGADVITQATLYMVGFALIHPFTDGSKRTGYISGMTFLQINGIVDVMASLNDAQMGIWLEQVVTRTLTFEAFAERLRERLARL